MNRHLVLPLFPCENRGRAETFCNLCGHQPFHCHLSLIKKAALPVKDARLSAALGFEVSAMWVLVMLASHTQYHLGSCDAALRDHDLPGVF